MAECDFYSTPRNKAVTKARLEERHRLHLLQGEWHGSSSTCRIGEIVTDSFKKKTKQKKQTQYSRDSLVVQRLRLYPLQRTWM